MQSYTCFKLRISGARWLALALFLLGGSPNALALDPTREVITPQKFLAAGFRGFNLDKQRGHVPPLEEKDFRDLHAMNANLVRIMVAVSRCSGCERYVISKEDMAYADFVVTESQKFGLSVVLCLETLPQARQAEYWTNPTLNKSMQDVWVELADHFKDSPSVIAYDLINEPTQNAASGAENWSDMIAALARAVRSRDKNRLLIVEMSPGGGVDSYRNATPIHVDPNVLYSVHFYVPVQLTHQGVMSLAEGKNYPRVGTGPLAPAWNKDFLSKQLDVVRQFVHDNNLPGVYVGELGCIRWAPGDSCTNWARDSIDLIEAEHWPWTYHAFRQWNGFDPEISSKAKSGDLARHDDAPVIQLLKSYFKRNSPLPS